MDASQLEPAERDPVKLRNTALILVAFMIIGGGLITYSYKKYMDSRPFRPTVLDRFSEFEALKLQEAHLGEKHLTALWGKVWIAAAVSQAEPEKSAINLQKLQEIISHFPADERPPVVLFFIDVKPEEARQLKSLYPEFGDSTTCWRVSANDEQVRDTLKKGLKIEVHLSPNPDESIYTHAGIVIVDKNRHLRGWKLDNDFDFQVVAKHEEEYKEALKAHSSEKLNKPPVTMLQMEELFTKTIHHLNEEEIQ